MEPTLYRCDFDDKLVREKDFPKHLGHRLYYANKCSIVEFLMYNYWRLTGQL